MVKAAPVPLLVHQNRHGYGPDATVIIGSPSTKKTTVEFR